LEPQAPMLTDADLVLTWLELDPFCSKSAKWKCQSWTQDGTDGTAQSFLAEVCNWKAKSRKQSHLSHLTWTRDQVTISAANHDIPGEKKHEKPTIWQRTDPPKLPRYGVQQTHLYDLVCMYIDNSMNK
jgi:hypothetical protein